MLRTFSRNFVALVTLLLGGVCYASESAGVIVYQPIITESEAHPKGFTILPIPFFGGTRRRQVTLFFAITKPNQLLTDAPPQR